MRQLFILVFAALCLAACASKGGPTTPGDPWEGMNRRVFGVNEAADRAIVGPLARGYQNVTPKGARQGVTNFLEHINTPTVFANDVLQFKPKRAGITLARAVINTIFGIGGLLDAADQIGLEGHTEDFGQTLAVWGVPEGPYVVVPFFGPSTVRDGFGTIIDSVAFDPLNYIEFGSSNLDNRLRIGRGFLGGVNTRAEFSEVFETLRSQPEPYIALRRAYLGNREAEIRDGELPEDPYEDLPDFEDFDDFDDFEDDELGDGDVADEGTP